MGRFVRWYCCLLFEKIFAVRALAFSLQPNKKAASGWCPFQAICKGLRLLRHEPSSQFAVYS